MNAFVIEAMVDEEGKVVVPRVPFALGTRLIVTLEEVEPMDRDAFETALRSHYGRNVE